VPKVPPIPLFKVDAFAAQPFQGNPAAVCLLSEPLAPELMQKIAAEMNLSETAFVGPPDPEQAGVRKLQWFTPEVEVPLCGHATLATSHVLLRETGETPPFRFDTLSGILTVDEEPDGWIRMDFPSDLPHPDQPPEGLLEALGCPLDTPAFRSVKLWIVRLDSEEEVLALAPDWAMLGKVDLGDTPLGVSVTAPGTKGFDFVSRFFGPWVGVDEDPVTGMAHTVLGPYWMAELGSEALRARQVSARGGNLRVRMDEDRVHVSGQALTVVRGTLQI